MTYSSRFFLYGPFCLFVALAAGVMGYWWISANALSQRLDALNGHEIMPGIRFRFAAKHIAGFPFRVDAVFADPTLEIAAAGGPLVWHGEHLATHALSYRTALTILEAAGRQEIAWTDSRGRRRSLTFVPGALRASAMVEHGALQQFDLRGVALGAARFAIGRAEFHLRHDPAADALDLVIDLQAVRFAGDAQSGFAHGLTQARVEGRLAPGAAFAPLLAGRSDWRAALEHWRMAPGSFKIDQAAFGWDRCQATSAGLVRLDDSHRLSGALAFSLAHCGRPGGRAAERSPHPRDHRALQAVLADLAGRVPADANGALPVMMVGKNGLLFLGPGRAAGTGAPFEPIGVLHALY